MEQLYRRLSAKSRHADFPLEKPTCRFFAGKADTSIFHWKSRHVDFSLKKADTSILVEKGHTSGLNLNYYYLSWDPLTLDNRSVLYLYVFSDIVSSIIHLSNWSFFNQEKISGPTCPLLQPKIDVSAFSTENRRVGFSSEKSTCQLFQRKIDVSAFPAKNRRVRFSSGKSTCRLFPPSRRYGVSNKASISIIRKCFINNW